MDKIIEKKTGWRVAFTKKALPWWLGALLLAFIVYLIARPNNKTLRLSAAYIQTSRRLSAMYAKRNGFEKLITKRTSS